jgi:hypothetical protein
MISWPHSRSRRTASIRSGRAGGLAAELDALSTPRIEVRKDAQQRYDERNGHGAG